MFYGSQTGTGEEFASRIAKEGAKYRMKGMVADPEECDMVLMIFIHLLCNLMVQVVSYLVFILANLKNDHLILYFVIVLYCI